MSETGDPSGSAERIDSAWTERSVPRTDELVPAVVETVAQVTQTSLHELPPLYDVVDGEAMEAFIGSADGRSTGLRFEYAGHEVVVLGDRTVRVGPREE